MAEVLACGTWKCGATCTDCWKAPYTTSSFKERLEDSERPQHVQWTGQEYLTTTEEGCKSLLVTLGDTERGMVISGHKT